MTLLIRRYDSIKSRVDRRQTDTQRSIQSVIFKSEVLVMFTMISHKIIQPTLCVTAPSSRNKASLPRRQWADFWLPFLNLINRKSA